MTQGDEGAGAGPSAAEYPQDKKSGIEDARTREVRSSLSEREIHEWWEADYLNSDLNRFYDQVFDRIIQTLAPMPGETLLDAGCGYGFHAVRPAPGAVHVTVGGVARRGRPAGAQ